MNPFPMKPQRSSGTSQSRPYPARPVKGEESAGRSHEMPQAEGGRKSRSRLPADMLSVERFFIDLRLPKARAYAPSEHLFQRALIRACTLRRAEFPELRWLHAIPNGGLRNKIVAAKMKAEGQQSGVPDIFLPIPRKTAGKVYHGLYLELKAKDGSPSADQWEWILQLYRSGYAVHIVNDLETALKQITDYLSLDVP